MSGGLGARLCAVFALVATSFAVEVSVGSPAGASQAAGENGRIVYVNKGALWTMDSQGNRKIKLTTGYVGELAGVWDNDPEWSPNGRRIVFTRTTETGPGETETFIWTINADGSNPRQRSAIQGLHPTWSPDGAKIAFDTAHNPSSCTGAFEDGCRKIVVLDLASGEITNYLKGEFHVSEPAWSPDGKNIAFAFGWGSNTKEYGIAVGAYPWSGLYSTHDGTVTDGSNKWLLEPTWSPDGSQLAYTDYNNGNVRITDFFEGLSTYGEQFGEDGTCWHQPAWSPDGTKIACHNNGEIIAVDVDDPTQSVTLAPYGPAGSHAPHWDTARGKCHGQVASQVGGIFDDAIIGTPYDDVIVTFAGRDSVDGLGGNDIICGGDGKDTLTGGDGDDFIQGNGGADTLKGSYDNDYLNGGLNADAFYGGDGADVLAAKDGVADAVLNGGAGSFDGGEFDTIDPPRVGVEN